MLFSIFFYLHLCLVLALVVSQVYTSIPLSPTQYAYHAPMTMEGTLLSTNQFVEVEYYLDLSCSSCLDAWPTISKVTETYSVLGVKFIFRIFPLPYHQQAFILSKATAVVDFYSDSPDDVFNFMNTCYENQALILNSATANKTYNEVFPYIEKHNIYPILITNV